MKLVHDEFADFKNTHPNVSEEEKIYIRLKNRIISSTWVYQASQQFS